MKSVISALYIQNHVMLYCIVVFGGRVLFKWREKILGKVSEGKNCWDRMESNTYVNSVKDSSKYMCEITCKTFPRAITTKRLKTPNIYIVFFFQICATTECMWTLVLASHLSFYFTYVYFNNFPFNNRSRYVTAKSSLPVIKDAFSEIFWSNWSVNYCK
jgi:hypothetical protein